MSNEKEIFGAFDSELMHQEIFIPEGFEATIDGDKIILTRKESEDERMRNIAIDACKYMVDNFENSTKQYEDAIAWLEKQGQEPRKVSIWKHWKDGICGNGEGKLIYLIKKGYDYSLSSSLGFECDYILLSDLDNLMLEKQDEQELPIEKLPEEMKTIGESLGFTTQEECDEYNKMVSDLIMSDNDKGEQKPADKVESMEHSYITTNSEFFQWIYDRLKNVYNENPNVDYMLSLKERIEDMQKSSDKEEPKFKVGDYIERKDGLGCHAKIIFIGKNVYGCEKLIYPEDSSPFFELMFENQDEFRVSSDFQQKSAWGEEDKDMIQALNACIDAAIKSGMNYISFGSKSILVGKIKNWLNSLENRYTWKPSEEQMDALYVLLPTVSYGKNPAFSLYNDLKKLKGE